MEYEFKFETTTGAGEETVQCVLEYSIDEEGTYAENLKSIHFEGTNVFSLLSDEQFVEIEMRGTMMLSSHLIAEADHSKSVDYDMRAI
jgi:hypothetical protein